MSVSLAPNGDNEGDDGDDELCHAYEKGCESHKRRFLRSVLRHQEVEKREITGGI